MPLASNLDNLIWNKKTFPNKISKDEDIVFLVREDIAVLIFKAIAVYFLFFLLLIFRVLILSISEFSLISLYDSILYGSGSFLVVVFLVIFHNYYLSMQIVTNYRIIDIDQKGLFKREVNSMFLSNIQDVTFQKSSFLQTVLNFGNVTIETSGNSPRENQQGVNGFVFNNVPEPSEITHLINQLSQQQLDNQARQQAQLHAIELQKVLNKRGLT